MGDVAAVAVRFNDHITNADLPALVALMAPEHRFVDPAGTVIAGREACATAWEQFFTSFPGYHNVFESVDDQAGTVVILGYSECPGQPDLTGPARWTATVRDGLLTEWRVEGLPPPPC